MATIPREDQDLLDNLNRTMGELYDEEAAAAANKNEPRRLAIHREIGLIRGLIKSVVDFHIEQQG